MPKEGKFTLDELNEHVQNFALYVSPDSDPENYELFAMCSGDLGEMKQIVDDCQQAYPNGKMEVCAIHRNPLPFSFVSFQ